MAKIVATVMGVIFIVIGLIGFIFNNFAGAHLTPAHNIIHLVSGVASLYFGLKASPTAAKLFCYSFGAFYLLLAVVGYWLGYDHNATYLPISAKDHGYNENMFWVIPGVLELGTIDHIIHILIAAIYLIAASITRTKRTAAQFFEGSD